MRKNPTPTSWEALCLAFIAHGKTRLAWSVRTHHGRPVPPRCVRKGWARYTGRQLAATVKGLPALPELELTARGAAVLRAAREAAS